MAETEDEPPPLTDAELRGTGFAAIFLGLALVGLVAWTIFLLMQ